MQISTQPNVKEIRQDQRNRCCRSRVGRCRTWGRPASGVLAVASSCRTAPALWGTNLSITSRRAPRLPEITGRLSEWISLRKIPNHRERLSTERVASLFILRFQRTECEFRVMQFCRLRMPDKWRWHRHIRSMPHRQCLAREPRHQIAKRCQRHQLPGSE